MPSVYQLKSGFQNLLRPSVCYLERRGVTANSVTVFAMLLSFTVAAWLALTPENRLAYFAYPLFLFLRMALNAMDGMLAREFGQKSHLGAFLNELCDVLSDAALFLAIGMIAVVSMPIAAIFTTLAIATELVGVVSAGIGGTRRYDGPMGKSDRAFVIGAFMFAVGLFPSLVAFTDLLLVILSILCVFTGYNRINRGLNELADKQARKEPPL